MRTMRNLFCILCLLVSSGCGALSQGRPGMPFGSNADEEAFKKAVAADSFPRADQAGMRAISRR
ncbi:MAG: hypothetical protein U9N87_06370 [Planctomycetota bacterium]|nr:hypothetical protein [Planctomycetota bacterium]